MQLKDGIAQQLWERVAQQKMDDRWFHWIVLNGTAKNVCSNQ